MKSALLSISVYLVSQSELARRMGIARSTLCRGLDEMRANGLKEITIGGRTYIDARTIDEALTAMRTDR